MSCRVPTNVFHIYHYYGRTEGATEGATVAETETETEAETEAETESCVAAYDICTCTPAKKTDGSDFAVVQRSSNRMHRSV